MLKEKGMFSFWLRWDLKKKAFILKIVSNRRDKNKTSKGSVCYIKS
jgi:hypothetical protein